MGPLEKAGAAADAKLELMAQLEELIEVASGIKEQLGDEFAEDLVERFGKEAGMRKFAADRDAFMAQRREPDASFRPVILERLGFGDMVTPASAGVTEPKVQQAARPAAIEAGADAQPVLADQDEYLGVTVPAKHIDEARQILIQGRALGIAGDQDAVRRFKAEGRHQGAGYWRYKLLVKAFEKAKAEPAVQPASAGAQQTPAPPPVDQREAQVEDAVPPAVSRASAAPRRAAGRSPEGVVGAASVAQPSADAAPDQPRLDAQQPAPPAAPASMARVIVAPQRPAPIVAQRAAAAAVAVEHDLLASLPASLVDDQTFGDEGDESAESYGDLDAHYRERSAGSPDPMFALEDRPDAVSEGDEAEEAMEDEWINPNQLGLSSPANPDAAPRGVIVPLKSSAPVSEPRPAAPRPAPAAAQAQEPPAAAAPPPPMVRRPTLTGPVVKRPGVAISTLPNDRSEAILAAAREHGSLVRSTGFKS